MISQFKNGEANTKKIMSFLVKNNDGKIYKKGIIFNIKIKT